MRYKQIKPLAEQTLNEINMSPSSLKKLAGQIDARAGMEFEMIVPVGNSEPQETEEDMSADRRARGIGDICEFYFDSDFNGRRQIQDLREELESQYQEWKDERKREEWSNNEEDKINEYIRINYKTSYRNDATHEIKAEYPDLPIDSDEFRNHVTIKMNKLIDAAVEDARANMGELYDEAFSEWSDEYDEDDLEEEWLRSIGVTTMYDVLSNINDTDITWPYWTTPESEEADIQQIADSFSRAVGRPITASNSYHSARRSPNTYVVEPDGSLEAGSNERGLEFVSPPLPLADLLSDLQKVKKWADATGCYTSEEAETGLHINVSVPDMTTEKLDYVKLALLLGDERVLNEFGRAGNTYCKSALGIVKQRIKQRPADAKALLDKMKENLGALASKAIHTGTTDKYTSINTKGNYVEFRSPGGDWLDTNFEMIEPTLLRFVVALDAAMDPQKYREEYLKKFYKVIKEGLPDEDSSTVQYFADYVAGNINKDALKNIVKAAQGMRTLGKQQANNRWEVYDAATGEVHKIITAADYDEAVTQALAWGRASGLRNRDNLDIRRARTDSANQQRSWWEVSHGRSSEAVIAATKEEAAQKAAAMWRITNPDLISVSYLRPATQAATTGTAAATLNGRPSNPDGNWFISQRGNAGVPVYRFMASDINDAHTVEAQWSGAHPGNWVLQYDPGQAAGQPSSTSQRTSAPERWYTVTNSDGFRMDFQGSSTDAAEAAARARYPRAFNDVTSVVLTAEPAAQSASNFGPSSVVLTPEGPGPWEIVRLSTGTTYRELSATTSDAAQQEATRALGLRAEDPANFAIRTRQSRPLNHIVAPGLGDTPVAAPHAAERFEIYNRTTNETVTNLDSTNQRDAWAEAQRIMSNTPGVDLSNYSVRAA